MKRLIGTSGLSLVIEDQEIESLINHLMFGWFSTNNIRNLKTKDDMMMLVRILRNFCNVNRYWTSSSYELYGISKMTDEQIEWIRTSLMPFLKNSQEIVDIQENTTK